MYPVGSPAIIPNMFHDVCISYDWPKIIIKHYTTQDLSVPEHSIYLSNSFIYQVMHNRVALKEY
jgi:hypothetical protein